MSGQTTLDRVQTNQNHNPLPLLRTAEKGDLLHYELEDREMFCNVVCVKYRGDGCIMVLVESADSRSLCRHRLVESDADWGPKRENRYYVEVLSDDGEWEQIALLSTLHRYSPAYSHD